MASESLNRKKHIASMYKLCLGYKSDLRAETEETIIPLEISYM